MMKQTLRTLAVAAVLSLVGASVQAQTWTDQDGKERKVEKHKVVVIDKDGKQQVFEGDGLMMRRGYLGIGLTDLTPELRSHFGVPEGAGVMVSHIEEGSPAAKAGIKIGDIVTRLDGKDLESSWDVRSRVRGYKDGDQVPLEIWRGGKAQTLNVTIAERERPEIDVAPMFFKTGEDGKAFQIRVPELGEGAVGWKQVEPGENGEMPPGVQMFRMRSAREAELEKKLEALEKRLSELEKQLKK